MHRWLPAALVVLLAVAAEPAAAATCAEQPVRARGDSSRLEVLAQAKARANWRAKVRAMAALGALYADWGKSFAPHYRCEQKDGRHTCTAVAYPCRD